MTGRPSVAERFFLGDRAREESLSRGEDRRSGDGIQDTKGEIKRSKMPKGKKRNTSQPKRLPIGLLVGSL